MKALESDQVPPAWLAAARPKLSQNDGGC